MMLIPDFHSYVLCTYQFHLFRECVTAIATYSNNNCDCCSIGMFGWFIWYVFICLFFVRGGKGGEVIAHVSCMCTDGFYRLLQLKHPPCSSFGFLSVCTALSPD